MKTLKINENTEITLVTDLGYKITRYFDKEWVIRAEKDNLVEETRTDDVRFFLSVVREKTNTKIDVLERREIEC